MTENLSHMIRYTPTDKNGNRLYYSWLVLIDTVNKTLQWREHWIVDRMPLEKKQELEDYIQHQIEGFKWFSQYRAVNQGESSSTVIWSTSEEEAKEVFERMDINNDKIERI